MDLNHNNTKKLKTEGLAMNSEFRNEIDEMLLRKYPIEVIVEILAKVDLKEAR